MYFVYDSLDFSPLESKYVGFTDVAIVCTALSLRCGAVSVSNYDFSKKKMVSLRFNIHRPTISDSLTFSLAVNRPKTIMYLMQKSGNYFKIASPTQCNYRFK